MAPSRRPLGPLAFIAWLLVGLVGQVVLVTGVFLLDRLADHIAPRPELEVKKEVEVTWLDAPVTPPLAPLPVPPDTREQPPGRAPPAATSPTLPPPQALKPEPPKPEPKKSEPKPPEPEKLAAKKIEPKPVEAKPEPPPPPPPKAAIPRERRKTVEVDDEKNVVNQPPPDAEYWSDKNRRVAIQTRDTRTNLDRASKGKSSPSEKSEDTTSPEVGGPEERIRQLEKAEATSLERKRLEETAHSGDKDKAEGVLAGDKGQQGKGDEARGDGGDPGALAMRDVDGRGAPGRDPSPKPSPSGAEHDDAPEVALTPKPGGGPAGDQGRAGRAGKPGRRGPKLQLDMQDYARIAGSERIKEEAAIARRSSSHKKGRWEKKLAAIHSSLENFVPEVRPGNQTALGTRAAPFAVYIARMHRRIHELWGFGFLDDLASKHPGNPMNRRDLAVKLEIVLNTEGDVEKATIVKPSGILTFDVAAIDTVMTAGPYDETPREIRSADGKVYLHWTFHRDERQCTPYYADPFVLTDPPKGEGHDEQRGLPEPGDAIAARKRLGRPDRIRRDGSPTESGVKIPRVARQEHDAAAAARATLQTPTPDDPAANDAAIAWGSAFEAGAIDRLVAVSAVPFASAGEVVARDAGALSAIYQTVLAEVATRRISEWKLLSAAGYRAVFGRLPKGGEDGTARLYLAVRLGKEWLTLDVVAQPGGGYRIAGLTR